MLRFAVLAVALVALSEAAKLAKRSFEGGYEDSYHKKPAKKCYQCAYSPPKTYYDKKVVVESVKYGNEHGSNYDGYAGNAGNNEGHHGGYEKKSVVPVPYTVHGGWDKCLGPFDHHQAKEHGVDVWDCHSNCYVRKDKNGNVFRGCYKGEYGVDPHLIGCHHQGDALWCFCEGEKCNHGPAPGH